MSLERFPRLGGGTRSSSPRSPVTRLCRQGPCLRASWLPSLGHSLRGGRADKGPSLGPSRSPACGGPVAGVAPPTAHTQRCFHILKAPSSAFRNLQEGGDG